MSAVAAIQEALRDPELLLLTMPERCAVREALYSVHEDEVRELHRKCVDSAAPRLELVPQTERLVTLREVLKDEARRAFGSDWPVTFELRVQSVGVAGSLVVEVLVQDHLIDREFRFRAQI